MSDNTEFVSVRLPADVANWLRQYATDNNLFRAGKPNMGGSIISAIRQCMNGITDIQTTSNNLRQSDFEVIVNNAIAPLLARIEALEDPIQPSLDKIETATDHIASLSIEEPITDTDTSIRNEVKIQSIEAIVTNEILIRSEALSIAQNFGFVGTVQNLYDWAKAAFNAKSEESKLSNRDKLAAVGLSPAKSDDGAIAWTIFTL
jgi:hypothetical protein